jgi:hypothetical protein
MKIIQFRCAVPQATAGIRQKMLDTINRWSRLQWLANDPEYQTAPFGAEQWHTHTTDSDLSWADVDAIYPHLGDTGRQEWDERLGDGPLQGILRMAPLLQALPDCKLEIVDVADPVAAGYLPAPEAPL